MRILRDFEVFAVWKQIMSLACDLLFKEKERDWRATMASNIAEDQQLQVKLEKNCLRSLWSGILKNDKQIYR